MRAVDPPPDDQNRETPLVEAAFLNRAAVAKLLIERKAKVNHQNKVRRRPRCVRASPRRSPAAHAPASPGAAARAARPLGRRG